METHHFAVGVFAQPRSQFNGAHEDKEETQREGKGDERDSPGRGHLSAPAATGLLNDTTENRTVSPGRCMGGGGVGEGGDGRLEPRERWRRCSPICSASASSFMERRSRFPHACPAPGVGSIWPQQLHSPDVCSLTPVRFNSLGRFLMVTPYSVGLMNKKDVCSTDISCYMLQYMSQIPPYRKKVIIFQRLQKTTGFSRCYSAAISR